MKIIKERAYNDKKYPSLSNHWIFEPTINFYIKTWKLELAPAHRNGIDENSDFIYRLDETDETHEMDKIDNYRRIYYFKDVKSDLLMRMETSKNNLNP